MTKSQILSSLQSAWWALSQNNLWNTRFLTANILFNTRALTNCLYTSSTPIQTNGLNSGTGPSSDPTDLAVAIEAAMTEAAQRLFDMHCTKVVGPQVTNALQYNFNAQG